MTLFRAFYLVFTIAAGGRSLVQWMADPGHAPLAYSLSTVAFCCYLGGYLATRPNQVAQRRRLIAVLAFLELIGVLTVGTLSLATPEMFRDPTVWSTYGAGYGFVPLVIPILLLVRLHHSRVVPFVGPAPAPSS